MDIIGSALAYIGCVISIVVSLFVLGYLLVATPGSATSLQNTTALTHTVGTPHKAAALSRLRKIGRHREMTLVGRADMSAGHARYTVGGPATRREHRLVPPGREKSRAYTNEPRANYAQKSFGDSRFTW